MNTIRKITRPHRLAVTSMTIALGALLFPTGAAADSDLGGVDLDGYCRTQGYERAVLDGPAAGEYAAYNWKCEDASGRHGIDVQDACRKQKGNPAAYGIATDLNSAYTWRCYLPAATAAADSSCLPSSLLGQVGAGPSPGTPSEEPPPSSFGESGGDPGAAPTDLPPVAGPESDPCAWRGTFQDGRTLAGDRKMVDLQALKKKKKGKLRVRFALLESVPWKVCVLAASGGASRCAIGNATQGDRQVLLRSRRGKKMPKAVQVQFTDTSSGALQTYDARFKGRKGKITSEPVSLASAQRLHHLYGNGYPDGVGDWLYGNRFSDWIDHVISKNWWIGFGFKTCLSLLQKHRFIEYYKREQRHIRDHFSSGYNLGRPSSSMRIDATGFGGTSWRFYQLFSGGSWGPSSLTAPRSQFLGDRCSQKPHLITGAIYRKWSQIGHVRTIGGPLGGQYRAGPFVRQNFEHGQIGFRDGNTGTVWYRYKNGPWRR